MRHRCVKLKSVIQFADERRWRVFELRIKYRCIELVECSGNAALLRETSVCCKKMCQQRRAGHTSDGSKPQTAFRDSDDIRDFARSKKLACTSDIAGDDRSLTRYDGEPTPSNVKRI